MEDIIYDPQTRLHSSSLATTTSPSSKPRNLPTSASGATAEGITETLKATNQMEWVALMNNIHSRVTEIINKELILR